MSGALAPTNGNEADADRRGQSAVVGLVLLFGLVAVLSAGILLAGTNANQDTQQEVTEAEVRQAFLEMDRNIDSVARSETGASRGIQLALPEESDGAVRRENAGRIVINRTNLTATETVVVKRIGAIVYESDDGRVHYAYQGGAVWRGEGNATRMVSAPSLIYETNRRGSAPTFTLPVTDLEGSKRLDDGEFDVHKRDTRAPLNDVTTVENQLVTITVESDYYVGWGKYFEDRYENAVVTYDHPNATTVIKLGKRDIDGDFDQAVLAGGNVDASTGNPVINGPVDTGTVSGSISCSDADVDCGSPPRYAPLDGVIDSKIQQAKNDAADVTTTTNTGGTLTAGNYYSDGFYLTTTLTFDLTNGNVSLVVDGPIGLKNGVIDVVNANQNDTCCYARIYVGDSTDSGEGDIAIGGGSSEVDTTNDNATRLQVYGTSEMQFAFGQSNTGGFDGAIYAPHDGDRANGGNAAVAAYSLNNARCSPPTGEDVCIGTGSGGVNGAVIGFHDVATRQSSSVSYDTDLQTIEPTLGYAGVIPPPITYLHVSVNDVCIGPATCSTGTTPTPTPGPGPTPTPGPGPTPTPTPTPGPSPVSAALDVIQTASGGFSEYALDASASTPAGDIDEYRWDFDDDGTVERVTTSPTTTVSCGNPGQDYASCATLTSATVVAVDTEDGRSDTDTEPYP